MDEAGGNHLEGHVSWGYAVCRNGEARREAGVPRPRSFNIDWSPAWAVQLVGDRSEINARASYDLLRKKHEAILGAYQPVVVRTTLGVSTAAIWHRVRIEANSRDAAETLCSRLRAAGGNCFVQRI